MTLELWQFWLMLILAIIGGTLVVGCISCGIGWLIQEIQFKIEEYLKDHEKYKEYYWEHHKKYKGLFEYETNEEENEEKQDE